MTMRRGRGSARRRGPRRRGFWVDTLISENVGSGLAAHEDLLSTPSQFDKFGLTVVRTILTLTVRPTTLFAAAGVQAVDLGIQLVEQDAFAAFALPDLNFADDQPGRGWLYRDRVILTDHISTGAVRTEYRIFKDLKGKRKIDDMELIYTMQNSPVSGTSFSANVEGLIRLFVLR